MRHQEFVFETGEKTFFSPIYNDVRRLRHHILSIINAICGQSDIFLKQYNEVSIFNYSF